MQELFYNFTHDGRNRGYSYLFWDESKLLSFTRFKLSNNGLFTNVFELKLANSKILACKHGQLDWINLDYLPATHYPACAYPLYLPLVRNSLFKYVQISEDDGSVVGNIVLRPKQDEIVEYQAGKFKRSFTMNEETPVKINWGGAVSYLCSNASESVKNSGVEFSKDFEGTPEYQY